MDDDSRFAPKNFDSANDTSSQKVDDKEWLKKPIVYLSSAIVNLSNNEESSGSLDYFVSIISGLSTRLYKSDTRIKADLVLKLPENNETGIEQSKLLRMILKQKHLYSAIIIAPLEVAPIESVLKELVRNNMDYKTCPIFFIDKYIGLDRKGRNRKINNVQYPYITSDWFKGGKKVAEFISKSFPANKNTKVLIIKGLEGSEDRINGFVEYITEKKLKERISLFIEPQDRGINFTREESMKFCLSHLATTFDYDVIFACNDEMALGAREAIIELSKNPKFQSLNEIKIIGFDGVKEFLRLSKNKNSNLIATVDVKLNEQLGHLINGIEACLLRKKFKVSDFQKKITPQIVYGSGYQH